MLGASAGIALATLVSPLSAKAADLVKVDLYSGFTNVGSGTPYTGFVGTITANDIQFGTNTNFFWFPLNLQAFGADITSAIDVVSDGTYDFALTSDDGSKLFIDNSLIIDNGGLHSPTTVNNSTFLTAGVHSLNVQFFQGLPTQSGVDLALPSGVSYVAGSPTPIGVPESQPMTLLGTMTAVTLGAGFKRKLAQNKKKSA